MLEGKIEIVIRKEDDQFQVCALFEIGTKCRSKCESSPVKERLFIKHILSETPFFPDLSGRKRLHFPECL